MRPIVLATVVLAASAAAVFLARSAEPFYPVSDIALTELFTREAAHGRLIVGPYSRFGWHHPGPTCFYLLAPFYAAGLVLRYGVYYLLVAPFEVFGRALTYGVEGGVDHGGDQQQHN